MTQMTRSTLSQTLKCRRIGLGILIIANLIAIIFALYQYQLHLSSGPPTILSPQQLTVASLGSPGLTNIRAAAAGQAFAQAVSGGNNGNNGNRGNNDNTGNINSRHLGEETTTSTAGFTQTAAQTSSQTGFHESSHNNKQTNDTSSQNSGKQQISQTGQTNNFNNHYSSLTSNIKNNNNNKNDNNDNNDNSPTWWAKYRPNFNLRDAPNRPKTDSVWDGIGTISTCNNCIDTINNNNKNNLCYFDIDKSMNIFITHHKNGIYGFNGIGHSLKDYCLQKSQDRKGAAQGYSIQFYDKWHGYEKEQIEKYTENWILTNNDHNLNIKILHMIRNPISTIISGYFYHAQEPSPENWLNTPMKDYWLMKQHQLNRIKKFTNRMNIDYNIIEENKNLPVNKFLIKMKQLSMPLAMYFEFLKYRLSIFDEVYELFSLKSSQKWITEKIQDKKNSQAFKYQFENFVNRIYNIKYEYFWDFDDYDENKIVNDNKLYEMFKNEQKLTNFDESINKLLNIVSIGKDGVIPKDIKYDESLIKELEKYDKHRMNRTEIPKMYQSASKNDREWAVKALLRDQQTCLELKQCTMMLDYVWVYPNYC